MNNSRPVIGLTQGDINGIGFELILKTLADPMILDICTPVIYGSPKVAAFYRKALELQSFTFNLITSASQVVAGKINILNTSPDDIKVDVSKPTMESGKAALQSLDAAIRDAAAGNLAAIVTSPINRNAYESEADGQTLAFPGHNTYLEQQLSAAAQAIPLMVNEVLRVACLTGHAPLSKVPEMLTLDRVLSMVRRLNTTLKRDFAIQRPRIAVLGLNPHPDSDQPGKEEVEILKPAIKQLGDEGILCFGPLPADVIFGTGQFTRYDAVLALYHDQAIVPFRTLSMDEGVNFTAGLPVIRTAPLMGPEYDKAGKNEAREESFRNAIYLAIDIYRNRLQAIDDDSRTPVDNN